jgi:putative solute:sodium symporter small subunit
MSTGPAHRFWRNTRRLTGALLGLWLAVTLLVPWFARDLGAWQVFGFPLGYWLAAKGALLLYLAIIVAYVIGMERLEAAFPDSTQEAAGGPDGAGPGPA